MEHKGKITQKISDRYFTVKASCSCGQVFVGHALSNVQDAYNLAAHYFDQHLEETQNNG